MASTTSPKSPEQHPSPKTVQEPGSGAIEADPLMAGEGGGHGGGNGGGGGDDDNDSAVDADSLLSTESLTDSIFEYRRLHGRTYQVSKTTEYWAPNDEQQNDGLDLLHNALVMMQDDKLFLAPVGEHPARVLDVGTGTGIWAIDFADQFPGAEVTGTDISPIQPGWVPPNVKFVIDDCLLDWTWPADHFDFVHMRALYGSVTDWPKLYGEAFRCLKPGGWLQDLEMDVRLASDHVELPPDHVFERWANLFYEGGDKMGRTFACSVGHTMRDNLAAAGFVDIVERKIKTPVHSWPRDPRLATAGALVQLCLDQSLEGLAVFVLTQVLGWSHEESTVLLAQMRRETRKKSNYAYCMTTVVYGRKPLEGEKSTHNH